jgi:hypothetical protein
MTIPTTTTSVLTAAEVESLELNVRGDLISAITSLAQLRAGGAHTVAGFPDWASYALDRFGDLLAQLRLPIGERQAIVGDLRLQGMSQRGIAAKLGVGLGTITEDIKTLREAGQLDDEPTTVTSGDGRDRPARGIARPVSLPLPAPTGRVYQQAAEWLRRAEAGLTLVELAAVSRWSEGKASGALSYLTKPSRGWAVRLDEERNGYRIHVLTDGGRAMLAALVTDTDPRG